jgi:8-oxo-dGTP pyrophosphatase MutT (NUDIX family)
VGDALFEAPPDFRPLTVGAHRVGAIGRGWLARALEAPSPFVATGGALELDPALEGFEARSDALARWSRLVRRRHGVHGWRDEPVLILDPQHAPLLAIERAMLRPLGMLLRSVSASIHGIDRRGPVIWVARRSDRKPVDPGRLDALVGGGIGGSDSARDTLIRECAEEAGIPASLARLALPVGRLEVAYAAEDDGLAVLHRESVALFELRLPAGFVPRPVDGEHRSIVAMTPAEALASIAAGGWTADGAEATRRLIRRHGWRG